MPAFEILLPIGAIGLYLFDSILLLYSNELLLVPRGAAVAADGAASPGGAANLEVLRWGFAESTALLIAGRRLYFPNPLAPAVAAFRVQWSEVDSREGVQHPAELHRFLRALRPVQFLVNVLLLILCVLPVELMVFGTGAELLVLMGLFYAVILVALSFVYARRGDLGLSGKAFAAVAFDAIACSPFAVNLVRKLCLRRSLAGNPVLFARAHFDAVTFSSLIDAISRRVTEEQRREYGQTPRWGELERFRAELGAMKSQPASHGGTPAGDRRN